MRNSLKKKKTHVSAAALGSEPNGVGSAEAAPRTPCPHLQAPSGTQLPPTQLPRLLAHRRPEFAPELTPLRGVRGLVYMVTSSPGTVSCPVFSGRSPWALRLSSSAPSNVRPSPLSLSLVRLSRTASCSQSVRSVPSCANRPPGKPARGFSCPRGEARFPPVSSRGSRRRPARCQLIQASARPQPWATCKTPSPPTRRGTVLSGAPRVCASRLRLRFVPRFGKSVRSMGRLLLVSA